MIYNFKGLSFEILSVISVLHAPGFFEVQARPYGAISFRVSGNADFKMNGKSIKNEKGDIIYIPANMPYEVDYSPNSASIVIHLLDCTYNEAEKITTEQKDIMEMRFVRMLSSWRDKHSENSIKAYLYDLFASLEEETTVLSFDTDFASCIRYLDGNYSDTELEIEQLCKIAHLSRSSLQRLFNEYFGISAKQYILKLRMNKALDMLSANKHSVKEIAFNCGFCDEKYFSRCFKKYFGSSPVNFAEKLII